eukprot:3737933-Pyramimonas_sp.AAC.1
MKNAIFGATSASPKKICPAGRATGLRPGAIGPPARWATLSPICLKFAWVPSVACPALYTQTVFYVSRARAGKANIFGQAYTI